MAQQELSEQLDSLIAQLRSIEDIQQTSPEFDTYVHKLINIKHKVTVIYSILQGAQVSRRVESDFFSFIFETFVRIHDMKSMQFHFTGSFKSNSQANRSWEAQASFHTWQWIEQSGHIIRAHIVNLRLANLFVNIVCIIMETPYLTHITSDDYKYVYEPAEDSFLLLDALEADLEKIRSHRPVICTEIGSGSGVIITAVAKALPETACFAIDINPHACDVTSRTARRNEAILNVINMNLLNGFRTNVIDLLIFNPPYVVTPDDEIDSAELSTNDNHFNDKITKSWAGGTDGRLIMDRVFETIHTILSSNGIAYILVIEENKPREIIANMRKNQKLYGSIVAERRIRGEHLYVLRFQRMSSI